MNRSVSVFALLFGFAASAAAPLVPGQSCVQDLQTIRQQFVEWIDHGGVQSLAWPANVTREQYESSMRAHLASADFRCVDTDHVVERVPQTCWAETFFGQPQIVCQRQLFAADTDVEKYTDVHYALMQLAGFEQLNITIEPNPISSQIENYVRSSKQSFLTPEPKTPAPSNHVRTNFKDFVGVYAIEHCQSNNLDNGKPFEDDVCAKKFLDVYFGDGYTPREDRNNLFVNVTNESGRFGIGIDLAIDEPGADIVCADFPGSQTCETETGYETASFRKEEDHVVLEFAKTWQTPKGFSLRRYSMTLKLVNPVPPKELRSPLAPARRVDQM